MVFAGIKSAGDRKDLIAYLVRRPTAYARCPDKLVSPQIKINTDALFWWFLLGSTSLTLNRRTPRKSSSPAVFVYINVFHFCRSTYLIRELCVFRCSA